MRAISAMKASRFRPPVLHLGELVLPVAGELGLGEVLHAQAAQQRHELEGLGRGHQVAPVAQHVLLGQQALDDGRARGRRAQALLGHGLAQLVVLDELARAFHGRQQRGLGVARRRAWSAGALTSTASVRTSSPGCHRHEVGVLVLRLLAVDRQPARVDQHLAVGLEVVLGAGGAHLADARGDEELGRRVEHRDEALDDQVVELGLDLGERLRRLQRGDDGEVVGDLGVVEDAPGRP
jgi:hypothetical protein